MTGSPNGSPPGVAYTGPPYLAGPATIVAAVVEQLETAYGSADLGNLEDPVEELVYISLTRQTHQWNALRSWEAVREVGGARAALAMSEEELAALIRDAGLSRQKARWVQGSLRRIVDRFGELSLSQAQGWPDVEVETFLVSLPGISLKSAKCIMLYSMGRQVLPVDTHVHRISERLQIVPAGLSERRIHDQLEAVVRPGDRHSFHVNTIWHGREVCTALRPACDACIIRPWCPYGTGDTASTPTRPSEHQATNNEA